MDINNSLIDAVRSGSLKRVRNLINTYGLSYSKHWSDGYALLCDSIQNNHTAVTKLLLTKGCKVNNENRNLCNTPLHLAVKNDDIEIVEMLIDRGAHINVPNNFYTTPLDIAIDNKNEAVTELLLKNGAIVNGRGTDGITSLHIATEKGCLQIVEHLLKHGAYVNYGYTSPWREGYTPLHIAAERGNTEIVKLLLSSNAYINASTKNNITPLYLATRNGHEKVVKLLLDHGANVDTQDKDGKTILYLAAEKGYSVIIEHILKHCPDVNNKNNRSSLNIAVYSSGKDYSKIVESLLQYGFSVDPDGINNCKLLHAAVEKGYLKIVEDLLKHGTDVNMRYALESNTGDTPLHNATRNKQEKVAALLINYGADMYVKDDFGKTPIFYTIENSDYETFKLLLTKGADIKDPELLNTAIMKECKEIIKVLLQHDADINASDEDGRTPLHFTVLHENELFPIFPTNEHLDNNNKGEIAKLLLSMGANVDAEDIDGTTALHAATKQGYIELVEILLEYNANVNCSDKEGTTPLHISASIGNKVITTMLLNKGANVNAKQIGGATALHMATRNGHKEVVEVLLKYDAKVDYRIEGGETPFHIAANMGFLEIITTLLKYGVDIDSRDDHGRTALHIASKAGNGRIVIALLEHDSDINIFSFSENNRTPLDFAMDTFNRVLQSFANMAGRYDSVDEYSFYCDRAYRPFEAVVNILKMQIIKLKTANLYVNRSNLNWIRDDIQLNKFQYECEKEIESMKVENISNTNVSFHDILTKNISQLAIYTRNENIVQVLKSDDYKAKFPLYASIINNRFRKGVERKKLLDQVNEFFHSFFNWLPELPYNCTDKIFSYLSDKDLRILINTCEHVNIPNTDSSDLKSTLIVKSRHMQ